LPTPLSALRVVCGILGFFPDEVDHE